MKKLLIGVLFFLIVAGVAVSGYLMFGKKKPVGQMLPTPRPKLTLPVNQVPVSQRPYVTLEPTAAREVRLSIDQLRKPTKEVEFELQYSAGEKEEAAIGSVNLEKGKPPYTKTILLGSQSGGGKITYHENVTGGTLVLSFYDENYKLSNEWSYLDNRKPQTSFHSRDGKFDIETAKLLNISPYIIVYQNPGLPKNTDKTLLAGPYSIAGTGILPSGKATLTMRLSDAKPVEIWGWTGSDWKVFPAKVDGKTATAEVELLATYIAVEK